MVAPRQWHKAFVKLPAAWRGLSYFKRSIMQDLWRVSDADCSGRIEIDGDPAQFLVRDLDIVGRRDRANAVSAVRELINDDGLITIEGTIATVRTERSMPVGRTEDVRKTHDRSPLSTDFRTSVVHRTEPKHAESLDGAVQNREKERVERESTRPTEVLHFRKPLPEPPPNLPPAERPPLEQILSAHAVRYSQLRNGETCPRDYRAAGVVLAWCEANAGVHKAESGLALALQVVAGLFESQRAAGARWKLSWAANDPAEFLPPPPGVKPVAAVSAKEAAEADRNASIEAKSAAIRAEYNARIKAARDAGDDYTPSVLAAERDLRLSKIHAQAS